MCAVWEVRAYEDGAQSTGVIFPHFIGLEQFITHLYVSKCRLCKYPHKHSNLSLKKSQIHGIFINIVS